MLLQAVFPIIPLHNVRSAQRVLVHTCPHYDLHDCERSRNETTIRQVRAGLEQFAIFLWSNKAKIMIRIRRIQALDRMWKVVMVLHPYHRLRLVVFAFGCQKCIYNDMQLSHILNASSRNKLSGETLKKRAFAGSIWTKQTTEFSLKINRKFYIIDSCYTSKPHG